MSQEELASRVEVVYGVSMSSAQLSKIESQKKPLLDVQLQAFALALDVQIGDLFPQRSKDDGTES